MAPFLKSLFKNKIPIFRLVNKVNDNENEGISLITTFWYKSSGPLNVCKLWPNPIILANTEEEYEYYSEKTDTDVIYANQNAFINEDRFRILDESKDYNMVVSSCFSNYKRVELCRNVPNVLHIGYKNGSIEYIPSFGKRINFKNDSNNMEEYRYINTREYVKLLNSSICGGIFSSIEGSCFSSSEYLLCGLPVISTSCKGGREIYYNEQNSIICDSNTKSVVDTFDFLLANKLNYNKNSIRENKLIQMDFFRNTLTSFVKDKLEDKYSESVDYEELKTMLKHFDNSQPC